MPILKVQTPQNVEINYMPGSVGSRLLAALIDLGVLFLYFFLSVYFYGLIMGIDVFDEGMSIVFFLIFSLPILIYNPLLESLWKGRTVGKYLLKLRVVRTDGTAPSLGDYILRWLLRPIDVKLGFLMIFFVPRYPSSQEQEIFLIWTVVLLLFPMPVVGIIAMAKSNLNQRLGDMVAGTVVIKMKKLYSLESTILQTTVSDYKPVYNNVLELSDPDINIIKTTLDQLEKTRNYKYVTKLAAKIRDILHIEDDVKDVELLKTIMRDYDHLAKKRDAAQGLFIDEEK